MFGIDSHFKLLYGNIINMIIFDKIKTGKPIIDAIITTIILTFFTYIFQFINKNMSFYFETIKNKPYDITCWFYNKHVVEYEGKIYVGTNYYDNILQQTNSFSNNFKALCYYIIENMNNNDSVRHIKEISFLNLVNNNSKKNNNILGTYMVIQNQNFLVSKEHEIYAYTLISSQNSEDSKENKKKTYKIENIVIQLYSYKSNITIIKQFVEDITNNYLNSIDEIRDNKKFIYTLTKTNYDESKYEMWDENMFLTTRQFNNIFFENKEQILNKINFFINNKDWYFEKGIPYSLGIGMHGPPGTGKTSLIKAIANYTNRHIIVISLKLIKTKQQLESIFFEERYNSDNNKSSVGFNKKIIVFEDIDCIGEIVMNRESKDQHNNSCIKKNDNEQTMVGTILETIINNNNNNNEKLLDFPKLISEHEPITLDDILNLWDGIRETPGRIMIISSNRYYELDPALIRPGRIDITLHLSYVSHKIIQEMYNHLFNETIEIEKLKDIQEYFYTPAEIINIYMNEDRCKSKFINRLCKNEHV
jgi:ATP-dependent 26S proteasome regulatory subunit